jgi:hypothetical protein
MAVAGRYIRSNLKVVDNADTAATSFSIDVAGFISLKRLRTTNLMDDGEVLYSKLRTQNQLRQRRL